MWIGLGATMAFVLYDDVFALLARTLAGDHRRAVTLVFALVGPRSLLPWIFPLLHGAGNGTMTMVRAAAIADLLGRSSFGPINGAIALPALVGRRWHPSPGPGSGTCSETMTGSWQPFWARR